MPLNNQAVLREGETSQKALAGYRCVPKTVKTKPGYGAARRQMKYFEGSMPSDSGSTGATISSG